MLNASNKLGARQTSRAPSLLVTIVRPWTKDIHYKCRRLLCAGIKVPVEMRAQSTGYLFDSLWKFAPTGPATRIDLLQWSEWQPHCG